MKLYITRHGETGGNVKKLIQDQLSGHLSERGQEQARLLAERLKAEVFDHVYCSDAVRTQETIAPTMKYLKDTPFTLTPAIRERHFGEYVGRRKVDLLVDTIDLETEEGETLQQVYDRVRAFVSEVLALYPKGSVLFVGHGLTNKVLRAVLEGKEVASISEMDHFKNAGLSLYELTKMGEGRCIVLNDASYLEE